MTGDPTNRRSFVTVQAASDTRDPNSNESRRTWATLNVGGRDIEFWADLDPDRANEVQSGSSQESYTVWRMRADYYDAKDMRAYHRVVFDGRVFNILGIMPDERFHKDIVAKLRETDEAP